MFWILNFIFSFLASMFFCVIFDAPRKLYLSCGFVGTCGWMVYTLFFNGFNVHTIYSSFFGSLALGLLSHYMARKQKRTCHHFYGNGYHSISTWWLSIRCYKKFSLIKFQYSNQYHARGYTYCRRHRIRFIIRRPNFQINCFWVREIF